MGFLGKRRGRPAGGVVAAVATMTVVMLVAGCTSASKFGVGSAGGPPGGATTTPVTGTTTTAPAALPRQPLAAWVPCSAGAGPSGAQCTTVSVPLDYANPTGPKISVALARHPAEGVKIGTLLVDPGGPGASGIDELDYLVSVFSATARAHFDIVGFDPRGVGRTSPVHCASGPQLDRFIDADPAPTTAAGFQALVNVSRTFEQGCQAMSGSLLPFIGTASAARDMDQIRQALGEAKLNYVGFSYGTFLGATYAEQFPANIRAMVLDGALNPAKDPITTIVNQAAGFEQELTAFFSWCAATTSCPWQPGADLRTSYQALIDKITTVRLPAAGGRTLGPGEVFFGVVVGLYDQQSWPVLAEALQLASQGDGSGLLQNSDSYTQRNADGTYSNQLEANNAINCVDAPWPTDPGVLQTSAPLAKQSAPDFGLADLYGGLACTLWPVKPTSTPHAIKAAGSPSIVVIGSTGDPATPYADAQALAGQLEHGVLFTRVGDGHTGYRSSACIRAATDAYLINGTLPASPLRCPTP